MQQEKVAKAQALAFISPVNFVGFPAMLKGWIEPVFTKTPDDRFASSRSGLLARVRLRGMTFPALLKN